MVETLMGLSERIALGKWVGKVALPRHGRTTAPSPHDSVPGKPVGNEALGVTHYRSMCRGSLHTRAAGDL